MAGVVFTLRDYRPEDFLPLWELDQSCFQAAIAYTQYELRSYMRRAGAFTMIAQEHSKSSPPESILGFIIAECDRGTGHIITIDVRASARRQKVGSTLLDAAETRMVARSCESVRLETGVDNLTAIKFYKSHGYTIAKVIPRYYSNGVDGLVFEKKLGPSK